MLLTVIKGPSYENAHQTLRDALKKGVDGVELRCDLFNSMDLEQIRKIRNDATSIYVMMTLRPASQGGGYQGSEESRLAWIEKLCTLHPDSIDLEYTIPEEFLQSLSRQYPHIKWVLSYHNFTSTPKDLNALYSSLHRPLSSVTKIATMAHSSLDALRVMRCVYQLSKEHHITGIAMGEHGGITRIVGPVFGNHFDYTYLGPTELNEWGQLSLDQLQDIYHYQSLNSQTTLYGLIGSPLNTSLGYLAHNAVFHALGINAVYVNMEISAIELAPAIELIKELPFCGLSVTMPLKEAIIPFLDDLTPRAKSIGAVNTIEINQGKLIGHNTDGVGALNAIERHTPVKGKRMVIIGAGGAAKAISYEALQRGALVTIINRTASFALKLGEKLNCSAGGLDLLSTLYAQGYDIIINCTPEPQPISPELILPKCHAMDLVYVPQKSPFLIQASLKQCHLIYGSEMFIAQAVEQQQIWFSTPYDRMKIYEIMNNTIREHL